VSDDRAVRLALEVAAAKVRIRKLEAQNDELWPHYTSTYCIHAHHEDCRETCKVCEGPCLCNCHKVVL
jgi:hypothetical protein